MHALRALRSPYIHELNEWVCGVCTAARLAIGHVGSALGRLIRTFPYLSQSGAMRPPGTFADIEFPQEQLELPFK